MGGDRDGNPNVTSNITNRIILLTRWEAATLYEKEFTKIIQKLSMHECSKNLRRKVGNSQEPYRVYLRPIRNKLISTQKEIELFLNNKKSMDESKVVQSINEIIDPLTNVYNSLCAVKCRTIADGSILDLLRRAYSFGINLVKVDIRQESTRHQKLMRSVCMHLRLGDFDKWTEEEKISFLSKEFNSKRPLVSKNMKFDKEDKETWLTFKMLSKLPRECLGAYVISMASNVSDILTVMVLQKKAGMKNCLRIVPLFETLFDLENSDPVSYTHLTLPTILLV